MHDAPINPSPGRDLAADEEHAPGCIRDHFGPGTHTCEPIPKEVDPAMRLREGPGVGFHVEPERSEGLTWKEELRRDAELFTEQPKANITITAVECTCTGPEIPDGGQHQVGCPRHVPPKDPFASNRRYIGDQVRKLMLEQAKARENIARSAVTYVLDEMERAIDTIRQSVLEQPEKLIESRNQRRAALRKDIEHVFALSGEDAESHQRLISNLVATLIWNGWTKTAPAADAGDGA